MNRGIRLSAFNLAFAYVVLGLVALVLFAAPLWYAWQRTLQDGLTRTLQEDSQRLAAVFDRDGPQGLQNFINQRVELQLPHERTMLLADSSMHLIAGNLPAWPAGIPSEPGLYTVMLNQAGKPTSTMVEHTILTGNYHILVGRFIISAGPLERYFWAGLANAVAVLLIFGIVSGIIIRRALLSRVQNMGQTVAAIMRGELTHRLSVRQNGDELDLLSGTINRMLDQIELLFRGVRNVSNAIAHDLRTPLAELRSRLEELAVSRPATNETFSEIEGAVADVDRVIRIFNALLRMAELDSGVRRSGFVQVDAAKVVSEAVEFYLPAAELKGVALASKSDCPVPVSGDPLLLAQAIGNLIDNALKYTPDNGEVAVETRRRSDGTVEITVADNGPGIPDTDKPKAVERFYRGDASRGTPGVGLGLSLVGAVAKLHGGILELADNHPGLRASMVIAQG